MGKQCPDVADHGGERIGGKESLMTCGAAWQEGGVILNMDEESKTSLLKRRRETEGHSGKLPMHVEVERAMSKGFIFFAIRNFVLQPYYY